MLPRLEMPSRTVFQPVERCLGTSPRKAARSRPLRKSAIFATALKSAVATMTPMPGIGSSARHTGFDRAKASSSQSISEIRASSAAYSLSNVVNSARDTGLSSAPPPEQPFT